MALSIPDWSTAVLRKTPGVEVRFRAHRSRDGSVAVANGNHERSLSVNEVALLAALHSPCVLPRALREKVADCDQVVARLVLDGLVEVRRGRRFVNGTIALRGASLDGGEEAANGSSRISELALGYALAIRHLPPDTAASRLYAFNSLPRTVISGVSAEAFARISGIDIENPAPRLGGKEWSLQIGKAWVFFRRGQSSGAHFKLYVCPHPESIAAVIPAFCEVMGHARSSVFKIAFPAHSLARADKIVAYFSSFEKLQTTVSELVRLGLDVPVQGVPFSAPVPGTELLSWGVDPPAMAAQQAGSWRSWVTRQVAECVHGISGDVPAEEALNFLRTALRLRDIDPLQWLPRQELIAGKWRIEL
ncbi:MAG: hypothetical protein WB992_19565 [Bryobacteraceae bacterium]